MNRLTTAAVFLAALSSAPLARAELAASAEQVRPILLNAMAPDSPLRTLNDQPTTLHAALAGKPTVLVFYRGGWCPFCNLHLSELRDIKPELDKQKFQLIAISPDSPQKLNETLEKDELNYTLLSDSRASAIEAFGIGFQLDDATYQKYLGFGIDLESHSGGEKHHVLPVSSVFVIDARGVIQFSYVNPNYKTRVPLALVRAAVASVASGVAGKSLK